MRCTTLRVAALVLACSLAMSTGADAQPTNSTTAAQQRHAGSWSFELGSGYGRGVNLVGSTNLSPVRLGAVTPRLLWDVPQQTFSPHGRRVALFAEIPVLFGLEPRRGYAAGLSVGFRYHFGEERRTGIYIAGAGGLLGLALENPDQPDGFSFLAHGDIGWRLPLGGGWMIIPEIGLHHISNGGLRHPNPGINDVRFSLNIGRRL